MTKYRLIVHARQGTPTKAGNFAFTLIELLVVIAIISILASLLFPGLSRAKNQAYSIKCQSNLRQLALALAMYVHDYGVYPTSAHVRTNIVGTEEIFAVEQGVKRCPGRVPNAELDFSAPSYGYNSVGYIGPKGLPQYESLGLVGGAGRVHLGEAEVRVPSDMIALGDSLALLPKGPRSDLNVDTVFESSFLARQETSGARGVAIPESVKRAAARHRKRANVAFCDQHVEAISFESLFLDRDDSSLRRWNRDNEPHR